MNEQMESLMYSAGLTAQGCWDEMDAYDKQAIERFYLLIVRECANWLEETGSMVEVAMEMKKHFGVEL
jgi:hypothetical protein